MTTRRDFLKNAAALTGGAYVFGAMPRAIARAASIDPAPNTTFHDAEHVVILMQENRSFDHSYGALRGVRGYRDPRAHTLPNGNPVWFQTDKNGDTYAPFRLDIAGTNATWIGGLPHSWGDQVEARAGGRYDNWLIAKPKKALPFTLGHYSRADIPFYYAMADAFTVCDYAFCSSLTGTTPNRLYLWSGTIRKDASDPPRTLNADTDYDAKRQYDWTTFPERLQDAGVTWRVYQNEVSYASGLSGDEESWLSNFTDNPLEWGRQFNVRFARSRRAYVPKVLADAPGRIADLERRLQATDLTKDARETLERELGGVRRALNDAQDERARYTDAAWDALSARDKALHERAFTTNRGDLKYRTLATLRYDDNGVQRETKVPAGDIFHQFRKDVNDGALPAVSWLVAPQEFSDHPSSAWYGAWYVSEALDILTKNPEVWKKTVFILCYDENDGYFDHIPPFVAPHPTRPETGRASAGIDTTDEWATVHDHDHSIGLGFRVPMVIASPWSRGGAVNSQVFDHTSILMFLERWLAGKGKPVVESNITAWRRTVCGDLTSAFKPFDGEPVPLPPFLDRDATLERIHAAQFRNQAIGGAPLTKDAIRTLNVGAYQESGTRPSCPLPYDLVVNAERTANGLVLGMSARRGTAGEAAQGAAFNVYSYVPEFSVRAYAVKVHDTLHDTIPVGASYRVRVDGPNGFMREFTSEQAGAGGVEDLSVSVDHASGNDARLELRLYNRSSAIAMVTLRDRSYGAPMRRVVVPARGATSTMWDASPVHGWYDLSVECEGLAFRYAGRIETGAWSITDPAMGDPSDAVAPRVAGDVYAGR